MRTLVREAEWVEKRVNAPNPPSGYPTSRDAGFHCLALETRYGIASPDLPTFPLSETEAFLQRHADALSEDFPDDIDDSDLGIDVPRSSLE